MSHHHCLIRWTLRALRPIYWTSRDNHEPCQAAVQFSERDAVYVQLNEHHGSLVHPFQLTDFTRFCGKIKENEAWRSRVWRRLGLVIGALSVRLKLQMLVRSFFCQRSLIATWPCAFSICVELLDNAGRSCRPVHKGCPRSFSPVPTGHSSRNKKSGACPSPLRSAFGVSGP